jgi:hypothetical protein
MVARVVLLNLLVASVAILGAMLGKEGAILLGKLGREGANELSPSSSITKLVSVLDVLVDLMEVVCSVMCVASSVTSDGKDGTAETLSSVTAEDAALLSWLSCVILLRRGSLLLFPPLLPLVLVDEE